MEHKKLAELPNESETTRDLILTTRTRVAGTRDECDRKSIRIFGAAVYKSFLVPRSSSAECRLVQRQRRDRERATDELDARRPSAARFTFGALALRETSAASRVHPSVRRSHSAPLPHRHNLPLHVSDVTLYRATSRYVASHRTVPCVLRTYFRS